MKKKKKKRIKTYRLIVLIFIAMLIGYGVLLAFNNSSSIIADSSKTIVYTSYEDTDKEVPSVNIKKLSNEINNEINSFVKDYLNKEFNNISYQYQINGNVLSLLITIEDYEIEGSTDIKFLSYNIDLKKLKRLNDDELLSMFDMNKEDVIKVMDDKFKTFYEDEKYSSFIDKNMSYDKYLELREISNFNDVLYFYIDNSKLNIYVDYNQSSPMGPKNYFADIGYKFEVK